MAHRLLRLGCKTMRDGVVVSSIFFLGSVLLFLAARYVVPDTIPMVGHIVLLLALVLVVMVAFGGDVWNLRSVRGAGSDLYRSRFHEMRMMPVRFASGIAGRSIVPLAAGECVVLHVPPRYLRQADLENDLKGGIVLETDKLEIHREPADSRWHVPESDLSQLSTFNCATYALGDAAGFTKSDWLELRSTSWTKGLNPTSLALTSHFDLIASFSWSTDLPPSMEADMLTPGDVVVFVTPQGYCHLGKVQASEAGNILVSKLGAGPLVGGSISATANFYAKQVTAIEIYHRRGK